MVLDKYLSHRLTFAVLEWILNTIISIFVYNNFLIV